MKHRKLILVTAIVGLMIVALSVAVRRGSQFRSRGEAVQIGETKAKVISKLGYPMMTNALTTDGISESWLYREESPSRWHQITSRVLSVIGLDADSGQPGHDVFFVSFDLSNRVTQVFIP